MLTMLLPTALPSASDWLPTQTARALTASSGSEVPERDQQQPGDEGRSAEALRRCPRRP